ncbi:hypothetical protein AB4212_29390, partial [Streptomyces sp. 2MCAF27]
PLTLTSSAPSSTAPPQGSPSGPLRVLALLDPGTGQPGLWQQTTWHSPIVVPPLPSSLPLPQPQQPGSQSQGPVVTNAVPASYGAIPSGAGVTEDGTPAVEPASRGDYRRTGPYAAELDGTVFALHESPMEGDRSADTLLAALRYAAPEALQDAGIDTPEAFRDWLGRTVTDADLSEVTVPSLDQGRTIPLSLLQRIGVKLGTSQQTQAALLGDVLPVSEVTRSPEATLSLVQRFQVLMSDPSYAGEGVGMPMEALVGTAVRALGVEVALAGPDGEVTFHGGPTQSAPPALLVRDGDRYLAGLPDGPGDTTGESEARLRRVVEAVSSAPVSVRQRLATRQAPDLDYIDNWGRYRRIAPLTEAELREHVATDGRFPDEHALDATEGPTGIGSDDAWDDASDGPADQEAAEWLAAHRDTLEDVRDVLVALGPDAVLDADGGSLTPALLERLVDDWFHTRNLEPVGSLAEKLHRILNDRA